MNVKLIVDDKEITLNDFVVKIVGGTIVGAVTSLREINKDWKKINIIVTK